MNGKVGETGMTTEPLTVQCLIGRLGGGDGDGEVGRS